MARFDEQPSVSRSSLRFFAAAIITFFGFHSQSWVGNLTSSLPVAAGLGFATGLAAGTFAYDIRQPVADHEESSKLLSYLRKVGKVVFVAGALAYIVVTWTNQFIENPTQDLAFWGGFSLSAVMFSAVDFVRSRRPLRGQISS